MTETRVLFFDIESSNLNADFGYILTIAWKWEGEKKVHTLSIADSPTFKKDPTDDKYLIEKFQKVIEEADLLVHHYGQRFDYPYLQTRALYHSLKPFKRVPHVDTWRIARYELKLHSNRLASVAQLIGAEEKTPLNGQIWVKAMAGHLPSLKYILKHNVQDVIVLEQVYHKLKAFRPTGGSQPRVSHSGCPACGSMSTVKRGVVRTVKSKMQRYQCNSCGHWHQRRA